MTTRPDVSPDATVHFDHHSDDFNQDQRAINAHLRQKCPVAWNENYDGFWYLSSYEAVSQTARDDDTFSHRYEPDAANGVNYQGEMGVPRPEGQPALGRLLERYRAYLSLLARAQPTSACPRLRARRGETGSPYGAADIGGHPVPQQ